MRIKNSRDGKTLKQDVWGTKGGRTGTADESKRSTREIPEELVPWI